MHHVENITDNIGIIIFMDVTRYHSFYILQNGCFVSHPLKLYYVSIQVKATYTTHFLPLSNTAYTSSTIINI